MYDPLEYLWPLLDARESTVAGHVVAAWPADVHTRLVELGLLREGERATHVLCPECHEHVEEVLVAEGPTGSRYVIPCPEVLRAVVPPTMLTQWIVDHTAFVTNLAMTLGVTGKCAELVSDRLWRLGRTKWKDRARDVLFARGLHWDDGASVRATLVRSRRPIVFVPLSRPPDNFWRTVPPLLVLADVAMLRSGCIEVETLEIAAAIDHADAHAAAPEGTAITLDGLKQLIRQQLKAEGKTQLSDDAFISAYRHCGSVREAAAFLTKETGQTVSKDQVHRALTRAGGAAAVMNAQDSDSLVRGVASQRRDKYGKSLLHSQPDDEE